MKKERVLIMKCDRYDPEKIQGVIKEGMEELGIVPSGKILLKPNVVLAHPTLFPHAFTRKEFLDGVLCAVTQRAEKAEEISVGERSGITIPTRFCFKNAGYPEVIKKHKAKTVYFEEVRQVPVKIPGGKTLRDHMVVPQPVADCDFLINLPKFKAHPWTRLTLSLKNFIGLRDDAWRLMDHNTFLEHKIADLQAVIQPKFIAVDAISAGQKTMLTPVPFHMGAIVMGTNSCAVDTVGCHMAHMDPAELVHLCFASERGFGPMKLDEIDLAGDFPLEEVRERTREFEFLWERVDDYFDEKSGVSCTVGTFPETHSSDYCWGGCPGSLQEAIHIFRQHSKNVEREMKKIRFVVGAVTGPLNLKKDERVVFMGDCASWKGKIDGKEIEIKSSYDAGGQKCPKPADAKPAGPKKPTSNDMILKNVQTLIHCFRNRNSRWVHAKGCTMSVADTVHYMSFFGKVKNPNFDPRLFFPLNIAYCQMRAHRFLNRLRYFFAGK